jgi:hypothetical protein
VTDAVPNQKTHTMENKTNHHFDQVIESFEERSELTLTDRQKRILASELDAFAYKVLHAHWSNMNASFDATRNEFKRPI